MILYDFCLLPAQFYYIIIYGSEYVSYVTTDGQSASLSWNKAPIWGLQPDFYYCQTVAGLFLWGALSDERTGLSFIHAAGPCQRNLSLVRVPWDSRPYFTVSDLRLPFSSPPTTRRVTVEVFDPASTRGTLCWWHEKYDTYGKVCTETFLVNVRSMHILPKVVDAQLLQSKLNLDFIKLTNDLFCMTSVLKSPHNYIWFNCPPYSPLHGPSRKHRFQQYLYFCMRIRCRGTCLLSRCVETALVYCLSRGRNDSTRYSIILTVNNEHSLKRH
jgi:hypothetical protein